MITNEKAFFRVIGPVAVRKVRVMAIAMCAYDHAATGAPICACNPDTCEAMRRFGGHAYAGLLAFESGLVLSSTEE